MDAQTIIVLTLLGVFLLLALGLVFFRRTVLATVEGFSWERQVFLEKYVWVQESSLEGFPEGSRNQQSTRESYQSYEFVRSNTRTTTDANGNTSMVTEPVYEWVTRWRTRYLYAIQRWIDSRHLISSEKNRKPYWPSYALDVWVSERVRNATEIYLVHFQSAKGKQFQRKMPEDAWIHFDEKDTYVLKITIFGRIKRVEPDLDRPAPAQELPAEMPEQIT